MKVLYDKSAEQAALGSMLLTEKAFNESYEQIEIDDFFFKPHQIIYKTMLDLFSKGTPIDLITLTQRLNDKLNEDGKNSTLELIGGVTYLTHLVNSVPTALNIEAYLKIVKEKANERELMVTLEKFQANKITAEDVTEKVRSLNLGNEIKEETFKGLLKSTMKSATSGVAHKFRLETLNHYLGGIDKGEIMVIGGYTSQGKTSFAIQLAIDFTESKKRVLYCTGEMTTIETSRRILSNLMPKNVMQFRKGNFTEEEIKSVNTIIDEIGNNWELNIKQVFSVADVRKYVNRYKPDIVIVDYIQNLSRKGHMSDYARVTMDMQELQIMTRQYNISTFVLSQLNRNKEEVRKPKLSDLRDSGALEEKAHVVMFVFWEDRLKNQVKERVGGEPAEHLKVIFAKNRDGAIGITDFDYFPEYCIVADREVVQVDY